MNIINKELLSQFRAPAFPSSYLLSFEGIEGAGKSTQILKARDYLEEQGFRVIILREPGGTIFGEKLRQAILTSSTDIHPIAEAHLFAASRAQLLKEVTLVELETPKTIVIYDRYIDSTIAYQGIGRDLGVEAVLEMHKVFPLCLVPHKTFYLEIDVETSHERLKQRNLPKDYFESRGSEFYASLLKGYNFAAEIFPDRIVKLDASHSLEIVQRDIEAKLQDLVFNI